MKVTVYIGTRLMIFIFGIICILYGTNYTFPRYIREDGYGGIPVLYRVFEFSRIFSIAFLVYTFSEINKKSKIGDMKLRNAAICLSVIFLIVTITLFLYL